MEIKKHQKWDTIRKLQIVNIHFENFKMVQKLQENRKIEIEHLRDSV